MKSKPDEIKSGSWLNSENLDYYRIMTKGSMLLLSARSCRVYDGYVILETQSEVGIPVGFEGATRHFRKVVDVLITERYTAGIGWLRVTDK